MTQIQPIYWDNAIQKANKDAAIDKFRDVYYAFDSILVEKINELIDAHNSKLEPVQEVEQENRPIDFFFSELHSQFNELSVREDKFLKNNNRSYDEELQESVDSRKENIKDFILHNLPKVAVGTATSVDLQSLYKSIITLNNKYYGARLNRVPYYSDLRRIINVHCEGKSIDTPIPLREAIEVSKCWRCGTLYPYQSKTDNPSRISDTITLSCGHTLPRVFTSPMQGCNGSCKMCVEYMNNHSS